MKAGISALAKFIFIVMTGIVAATTQLATEIAAVMSRCIYKFLVERDCAESQSQQYRWLALTPDLLRLVLRALPRS